MKCPPEPPATTRRVRVQEQPCEALPSGEEAASHLRWVETHSERGDTAEHRLLSPAARSGREAT